MIRIIKLYLTIALGLLALDCVVPHPAQAFFPHGSVGFTYANTCGSQPSGQLWCVSTTTGYTVFTATTGTGTCSNATATFTGTCVVLVSSSLGNDTTCAAQIPTTIFGVSQPTSALWSSISNTTFSTYACATVTKAESLLRYPTPHPDWMLLKRGDTFSMTSWALNAYGPSNNTLLVIGAASTGARPHLSSNTATDVGCVDTQATRGQYLAIVGIRCDKAVHDPSSPYFQGGTITADTTAGSPTLSNINAGAGLPSQLFTTAAYSLNGNGINNLTPNTAVGAGTTTLTMNGNATYTATQMRIQIQDRQSNVGMILIGTTNTLIIEDDEFDYGAMTNISTLGTTNFYPLVNIFIRRNVFNGSTSSQANMFMNASCPASTSGCPGGQITIEENASNYAAWNPNIWAYPANPLYHAWYLHNQSVPIFIHGNVVGNNASDNQYRDCGTASNNLFYNNSIGLSANLQDNQCLINYNVIEAANDNILGMRTVTSFVSSAGTILSIDGALSGMVGGGIVDLSNPGAIPNTATIASVHDAFSVNLSTSITSGIRGNGVQPGDTIEVFSPNGGGVLMNASGIFVDSGPASTGSFVFPGPSTGLTVSANSPSIATEPSASFARSQDEPFQFTAGTLPTGLALNTTYCADPANGSATAYPFYLPTSGLCSGGADINATGSNGTSIGRTGSRKFTFSIVENGLPALTIPTWVTADPTCAAGMSAFVGQITAFPRTIGGLAGGTTVQYISPNQQTLVTCDASIATITGSSPAGDGQNTFLFGVPNNPHYPTAQVGPNNIFVRLNTQAQGNVFAITWQGTTSGNNGANNYIYNWSRGSTTNNFSDIGFPGTNLPALSSSQVLNVGTTASPNTTYPLANIEAYDAANNSSGFNGTVMGAATFNPGAGSSYDGATLTINSGSAPSIGDMIFCTDCTQYMTVVSGSGSSFTVSASPGTMTNVGPIAMTNGSFAHFISQALAQNSQSGWNPMWTAANANNSIRAAIKCGNQTQYPGSPACPLFNFLLKRDLDPASNDNDPMWIGKAA
jgi:hypothetical protein